MKKWYLFVAIAFSAILLVSCSKETVPQISLEQKLNQKLSEMTEVAELGSVEYTVTKVVKASDDEKWYKVGDRKILFKCTAYLKAGIDLNKLDASKIVVDEAKKSVVITLPKAELLALNMPPDKSVLAYESVATFRSNFSSKEKNHLLQLGEKSIREDVPNLGILSDAEKNASSFFKSLLSQLGFEIITVKFE
ncbi:MAG: DUF4230 domain-containing protein [Bacteroidales bacterium]|nr:DUF4230 domain-containing protein [Bacteroidales bacterium]MCR5550394.1 DUF4230 domain-containing protein [Bacteroidales bacterium]